VEYTPPEPVEPPEGEKEAVAKLTPTPTPAPPLVVVPPVAIAPVQIKGPTRDPEAFFAPRPRIPQDELRRKGENDVRVRFIIAPDGSAQVSLVTSCGVPELDQSALAACRSWRWKPALRQGTAYTRVINERIEFVVI
jgi:protein TonB